MKFQVAVKHAAICVTDLKRSLDFFVNVLGFDSYHDTDRDWAMLSAEGTTLSLVRVGKKDPVSMASAKGSHPAHLGFVAKTEDQVRQLQAKLKALGSLTVGTVETHRDESVGFYFQDFDGNQFECIFIPYPGQKFSEEEALVLIAHGSKDPRWKKPLQALEENVRRHAPRSPVALCYMEFAEPNLVKAVESLKAQKPVKKVRVVPVFLSSGAHVADDIPRLVKEAEKHFPEIEFRLSACVGEAPGVLEALTAAVFSS